MLYVRTPQKYVGRYRLRQFLNFEFPIELAWKLKEDAY